MRVLRPGPTIRSVAVALSFSCIPIPSAAQMDAAATAASYRLRAGDAVRLYIQDEPELAGEYPVLEDGSVLLPLIGAVPVAGASFDDVVQRVRAAYAGEFVGLAVLVQPLVRVRVLGEVHVPGLYLVDATYGLEDVLAKAGGLSPSAAGRRVRLLRNGEVRTFDVRQGSNVPAFAIQPGDEIVVPRRSWLGESVPVLIGAGTSVLAAAVTAWLVR